MITVLIAAVRVFVSFAFLNLSINPAQAVALTTPAILAAAIGIFPAGLGLRELLAGAVALVVNLPVAQIGRSDRGRPGVLPDRPGHHVRFGAC